MHGFADKPEFPYANLSKCDIVLFRRNQQASLPHCEICDSDLPAGLDGKCLDYWWNNDLLATRAVDENIVKVRRAVFHFGRIGACVSG